VVKLFFISYRSVV